MSRGLDNIDLRAVNPLLLLRRVRQLDTARALTT